MMKGKGRGEQGDDMRMEVFGVMEWGKEAFEYLMHIVILIGLCYEEEVQPYRKTDYKPIIYIRAIKAKGAEELGKR